MVKTQRLVLAQVDSLDTAFIMELLNGPSWLEYIGDKGVKTREDAKKYIDENLIQSYQKHGFGLYKLCLLESGTPIGLCGFLQRDYLEAPDMGFALLAKYEGHGYMLEAALALLEYAKTKGSLDPILAIVMPTNRKSRALLAKIGFREEGSVLVPESSEKLLLYSNERKLPHSGGTASLH